MFSSLGRGACSGWSAGRDGCRRAMAAVMSAAQGQFSARPSPQSAAAAGEPARGGEQTQAEPLRLLAGGRYRSGRASGSRPAARRPARRSRTRPEFARSPSAAGSAARYLSRRECGPRAVPPPVPQLQVASCPRLASVAKQVNRWPSMSVNLHLRAGVRALLADDDQRDATRAGGSAAGINSLRMVGNRTDERPGRIFMHHPAWRERPVMPRTASSAVVKAGPWQCRMGQSAAVN